MENQRVFVKWGPITTKLEPSYNNVSATNSEFDNMIHDLYNLYEGLSTDISFEDLKKETCLVISSGSMFCPNSNLCAQLGKFSVVRINSKYQIKYLVEKIGVEDEHHVMLHKINDQIEAEINDCIANEEMIDIIYDKLDVYLKRLVYNMESLDNLWPNSLSKSTN